MSRIEKEFQAVDLSFIRKERENLLVRAQAESPTKIGRYIQYIFSLYPYDNN